MIDPLTLRIWLFRLLLLGLVGLITFLLLLPLSFGAGIGVLPGPDLILALVFAWWLRRPEYAPILLIAAVIFFTDLLFQNPPGLRAALVLLGLEFLRSRSAMWRDLPFAVEWALVALVMALILLGERLLLGIFMVEQVSFGRSVLRLLMTWLAYPAVVAASVYLFRVRRVQPGEADALRQGL